MKTAEKYFSSDLYEDGDYNWYTILDAIKKAQIDAYNQAIDDAAENARTTTNSESTSIIVDKQSILKLKK